MNDSKPIPQDAKKLFLKLGTCSRLFFYILDREFGYPSETEERAADPLCGGLMQKGDQCGMLWGSALAVGAESFRRHNDRGQAIGVAITATRHLMESFSKRTNSVNCRDVTGCDWSSKSSMLKYFFSGRFLYCFTLAEEWAPEAIQAATAGLSHDQTDLRQLPTSCASEVARKMGASDEEMVMVAGFAGGMGLSGNACGALGAAIWMNTLARCRNGESSFPNPDANRIVKAFDSATDSKILCHEICGQQFKTIDEHTEFMKNGGCDRLIEVLARS